jgi:hypothetical protein
MPRPAATDDSAVSTWPAQPASAGPADPDPPAPGNPVDASSPFDDDDDFVPLRLPEPAHRGWSRGGDRRGGRIVALALALLALIAAGGAAYLALGGDDSGGDTATLDRIVVPAGIAGSPSPATAAVATPTGVLGIAAGGDVARNNMSVAKPQAATPAASPTDVAASTAGAGTTATPESATPAPATPTASPTRAASTSFPATAPTRVAAAVATTAAAADAPPVVLPGASSSGPRGDGTGGPP